MDQLQNLAIAFTPSPRAGLAFSALPDSPVVPATELRSSRRNRHAVLTRLRGARHGLRLVRVRPIAMPTTCSH
jgi:hypothetical protein